MMSGQRTLSDLTDGDILEATEKLLIGKPIAENIADLITVQKLTRQHAEVDSAKTLEMVRILITVTNGVLASLDIEAFEDGVALEEEGRDA